MCMICVDFQQQKMTLRDATRAYGEMVQSMDPEHAKDVKAMLDEAAKTQEPDQKKPSP